MYIDIHCHLDHALLQPDIKKILEHAQKANVLICTAGIDLLSNQKAVAFTQNHENINCFLGVYPRYSYNEDQKDMMSDEEWEACMAFMTNHKNDCIGIGEIGLDFSQHYNQKQQEEDFIEQCAVAERWKKPVIIHSRKAEARVIELLDTTTIKQVILHSFCGKKKLLESGIDHGYYFSIPTNCVRSTQFQTWIQEIPLSQLFGETDSPFMSPYPEQPNEPAFVIETYKKIAEIKKITIEETEKEIEKNYKKIKKK